MWDTNDESSIPKSKGIDLDNLPTGYLYKYDTLVTGSGGAMNLVKIFREKGLSDDKIKEIVEMTLSDGLKTDTIFYPLHRFKEINNVK